MCWSDGCRLVLNVHVNVYRPACKEREREHVKGKQEKKKKKALRVMIKGDEEKRAACSVVLLRVFLLLGICIFIDLLVYFVFMRFAIKFHHVLCVIFYSKQRARRKLDRCRRGNFFYCRRFILKDIAEDTDAIHEPHFCMTYFI